MGVKLLTNIRQATGLKNYGIHKALKSMGCSITLQGIDVYDKELTRSIRLDVLHCLEKLCCDFHGIRREKFAEWVKEDALKILERQKKDQ